jgi:hypothetical protein
MCKCNFQERPFMKNLFFVFICLSQFTFAANDTSISGFTRGIVCQAIDRNYPDTLPSGNGRPGWLNCREDADFMKIEDYYGVVMKTDNGFRMSCSARIVQTNKLRKTPSAKVNCKTVRPK